MSKKIFVFAFLLFKVIFLYGENAYLAKLNDFNVKLREKPNLESKKIYLIKENEDLLVLARSQNKMPIEGMDSYWYLVNTKDNFTGWIYGHYVDILARGINPINITTDFKNDFTNLLYQTDKFEINVKRELLSRVGFLQFFIFYRDVCGIYYPEEYSDYLNWAYNYPKEIPFSWGVDKIPFQGIYIDIEDGQSIIIKEPYESHGGEYLEIIENGFYIESNEIIPGTNDKYFNSKIYFKNEDSIIINGTTINNLKIDRVDGPFHTKSKLEIYTEKFNDDILVYSKKIKSKTLETNRVKEISFQLIKQIKKSKSIDIELLSEDFVIDEYFSFCNSPKKMFEIEKELANFSKLFYISSKEDFVINKFIKINPKYLYENFGSNLVLVEYIKRNDFFSCIYNYNDQNQLCLKAILYEKMQL